MILADTIVKRELYHLNATDLLKEIEWFSRVVDARMKLQLEEECGYGSIYEITAPDLAGAHSVFAEFIQFYKLSFSERLVLMLALMPHVCPQLLDIFFSHPAATGRGRTEFGGLKGSAHSGFLPTGETALFLLAGNDLGKRFRSQQLFDAGHFFRQHNIVYLSSAPANEPAFSAQLLLNEEYVDFFTGGSLRKPAFSMDFPAKCVTTTLEWKDLVLDGNTMRQLEEIKIWLEHGGRLMGEWEMNRRLKPGYKALFYGSSGTGKTLTAGLLGKLANVDVYRVDLSMVISKYIGETEKNLEKVFARAEHKNWVLFFDEADSLFGKRTSISDAHDKYANQEIAYLLQRLEDYNGLVILSSNMRGNLDDAFTRRLQSVIHFPVPRFPERLKLWQSSFSPHTRFAPGTDLAKVAEKFELTGGSIINVVQYASLMALHRNENIIRESDIVEGIKKELRKEGKTI
jgi:hypothetical protein